LVTLVIVVIVLAVIVAFALITANQPSEAPIPEAALTRYEGITSTRTTDGYPRLGDPDAPVQVAEYSSFGCPGCKLFHDEAIDALVERVRGGNMAFTYVPLWQRSGASVANTQGAARAAVCAGEQNAFWAIHDAFFEWQSVYGNQAFTNSRILTGVAALGLDRAEYDACIGSGSPDEVLNRAQQQATTLINFVGTPTIAINGVVPVDSEGSPYTETSDILTAIDNAIAGAVARRQQLEATAEVTPESTEATEEATPEVTATPAAEETPTLDEEATPEATETTD
jgi:protein-disulfide isomerase